MDKNKRRSSLRKCVGADTTSTDSKTVQKRRISFSGKKSIRVFSGEVEPKAWDNSFEISDHLNVEAETNLLDPSKIKILQNSNANSHENKENMFDCVKQINQKNLSVSNISKTDDSSNLTEELTRTFQIENSVDITLFEKEHRFKNPSEYSGNDNGNLFSFSLENSEKRAELCEQTYEFMRELPNNLKDNQENTQLCDIFNKKEDIHNKENEISNHYSECKKSTNEPILCPKQSAAQIIEENNAKRKSNYEVSAMQLTFNEPQQHDKTNKKPICEEKINETSNRSYQMEIEDNLLSGVQISENLNKNKIRPTIYFDQHLETSSIKNTNTTTKKLAENMTIESNNTLRPSIYFNQSIDIDRQNITAGDNSKGAIPKVKPSSIIFRQPVETSPSANLCGETINLNEDMDTSHTSSQDSNSGKNFSISANSRNIQKTNQPSKVVYRKFRLPTPNKFENHLDMQKHRMLRHKKEQEEKQNVVTSVKKVEPRKVNKSLNFSLENLKNQSFSSDNSSPLMPSEFKGYTLKQLNDEIEAGKIRIFADDLHTSDSKEKKCNINSGFQHVSPMLENKSLIFDDVCIPRDCNKGKYRYSQADEMMLNNTSFLARAKLSDETMSQKSSKRDSTQFNDSMELFDETLVEATNNHENDILSSSEMKNIGTQHISKIEKELQANVTNLNIPHKEYQKPVTLEKLSNSNKENIPAQKLTGSSNLNPIRKTLYYNNEIPLENKSFEVKENLETMKTKTCRRTIYFDTKIPDESLINTKNIRATDADSCKSNTFRKSVYYNQDITMDIEENNAAKVTMPLKRDRKTEIFGSNIQEECENVAVKDVGVSIASKLNPSRNTLFYDKKIPIDNSNMDTGYNMQTEESNRSSFKNPSRKTLIFDANIQEDLQTKVTDNRMEECDKPQTRRTVFYDNDISFEMKTPIKEPINIPNDIIVNNTNTLHEYTEKLEKNKQTDFKDINPSSKTLLYQTNIQDVSILKDKSIKDKCTDMDCSSLERKTLFESNNIPLDEHKRKNIEKSIWMINSLENNMILESEMQEELNTDVVSSNVNPSRKTLYYNNEISLENSNLNMEQTVHTNENKTQNSNRNTILHKTEIAEVTKIKDVQDNIQNADSFVENRKTLYYNKEIPLEVQCSSIQQENVPNKTLEEESMCFEENKQSSFTETNICLTKTYRKTLLNEAQMPEASIVNTNVESCNFKPTRKTLHYNKDISLDNVNEDKVEKIEAQKSKRCLKQNPPRSTLLFETNMLEESNLKDEYQRDEQHRKTLHYNSEIPVEEETETKGNSLIFKTKVPKNSFINDGKKLDNLTDNLNPSRKTLYYNHDISLENANVDNFVEVQAANSKEFSLKNGYTNSNNSHENRKTFINNNEISLVKETMSIEPNNTRLISNETFKGTLMGYDKNAQKNISLAKPLPTEMGIPAESIKIMENKPNDNERETFYYNHEIPLETTLTDIQNNALEAEYHKNTNNNLLQNEFGNAMAAEKEKSIRKTIYFNSNICDAERQQQSKEGKEKPNANMTTSEELMNDFLDINKYHYTKNNEYESKFTARRKSVYTPENMELTLSEEMVNNNDISELMEGIQTPEAIANESNTEEDKFQTKIKDANDVEEIDEESFKVDENFQLPETANSMNYANMLLSRRFTKNAFTTPKKSIGSNRNFSICMTPRLSLLEFERLEKEENENCEISHKRLSTDLTPKLSLPKKKHILEFDDDCLQETTNSVTKTKDLSAINKENSATVLGVSVANVPVLQTPIREKKSRIPISINSANKTNKSCSSMDAINFTRKENDSQLEMEIDNFTDSIQLIRRATTFTNQEDSIKKLNINDEAPKQSLFEGNPITISDVSVFFVAQRESNIDISKADKSLPLEKTQTPPSNEKSKKGLESCFINLTLEDIDKTHLSLVRDYEDEDDDTADVHNFEQQEQYNKEQQALERHPDKSRNDVRRNETLVCRKCKRCQETFVNETNSSMAGSFIMPELPPLPDLGLERLRRLRNRPTIADASRLWKRFSLDRTIYNANISDDDIELVSDNNAETEDKTSVVSKFIEKYYADIKSFETRLQEKLQNTTSSELMPFVSRLETLLRDNCKNWIFDYQMQFRGIYLFKHRKLYTFTLKFLFDEVDAFGYHIKLKSIQLEKGHYPKKNWKPIDFVLEYQLKLNLPFNLESMCKSNSESDIFQMLQQFDNICLKTIKLAYELQRICFSNRASILCFIGGGGTYVRKIFRQIVNQPNTNLKCVKKTEIHIELLNIEKLSFKDIIFPKLHNFREDVHLLPIGLEFLKEFLPNALDYLKEN